MATPIEMLSNLVIGAVESVAPDDIRVLLELDAPHATALNTGTPVPFPRLNGYVLIPNEVGATVAYVIWIGVERSPYPKRSGFKDFGLIDLPFPLRKMRVVPVGTLRATRDRTTRSTKYDLARGVVAFPSVGDQVLVPSAEQVEAIVSVRDSERRIHIGASPLAANAKIEIDPDKLFGRHLAVLGNTGSGKSCTVAGLIRWSLDAASAAINDERTSPNARFIVLDPNGEYARAFSDVPQHVRIFKPGDAKNPFVLPAWMWNSHEWTAVTQAQPGVQRPVLMQALRNLRAGRALQEPLHVSMIRQVRLYRSRALAFIADASGASYIDFPGVVNCCQTFANLHDVMQDFRNKVAANDQIAAALEALMREAAAFVGRHRRPNPRSPGSYFYDAPHAAEFGSFLQCFDAIEAALPEVPRESEISADDPCPFDVGAMADHVDALSADSSTNAAMANFIATLTLRIRSMLADPRLSPVIDPDPHVSLEDWLNGLFGGGGHGGQVAIVDLSLVPSDVTHLVVAILGRLVFEASQRYRKQRADGMALPTVLVLEEAHTFIRRGVADESQLLTSAHLCRETFERIAREGRKFGLGLVLSSQRPSELSATVLAQCNTFMLHRIVNDSDQDLVARLVPDNVADLLRELPSLPSQQAVMLGWAVPLPILVEIRELPHEHRPQSADPDFWNVWTRVSEREVSWKAIADEWSGATRMLD